MEVIMDMVWMVLQTAAYLLSGMLLAALAMWVLFLPLRSVPTRGMEATTSFEEMTQVYARYLRHCLFVAVCYTLVAVILWKASSLFTVLLNVVPLSVVIAAVAWMFVPGTWLLASAMERRQEEGNYGLTSDEIAQKLR